MERMGRLIPGDDIMEVGARDRPNGYGIKLLSFRENLTLTRGGHTIKLGTEIQHTRHPMQIIGDSAVGNYEFDGLGDFLEGDPSLFETGLAAGTPIHGGKLTAISVPKFHFQQSEFGFYVQDNFSVTPSLTLNLGLRYEFQTTPTERDNHAGSLRSIFDELLTIGAPFKNPTKKNFSPRVGFAWAPGDQRTSIRGGVGIYYNPPKIIDWTKQLTTQSPFNVEGLSTDPSLRFPDAFTTQPDLLVGAPIMRYVEYDQSPTSFYRWSLTVEREQGPWFISAGYTGSRATHLWADYEANASRWDGWPNDVPSGEKHFQASNGLIAPLFSRITLFSAAGNSFYHGLTLNVLRRLSAGLQLQFAYSYSKAIDEASGMGDSEGFPQSQGTAYYWDKAMTRGRASFDIRNNSVTNLTYDLPRMDLTGVAGVLANGWQVSGILSLADGAAFQLEDEGNSAQRRAMQRRGIEGLRPNLIPGGNNSPMLGGPDLYYDPTQFVSSVCTGDRVCRAGDPDYRVGFFGNLGRNTLTGPGLATVDFSLLKNLNLTETKRFQFRAEFFNLFNHANFALPDFSPFLGSGARDAQAGRITSTNTTARQIQLALKFIF